MNAERVKKLRELSAAHIKACGHEVDKDGNVKMYIKDKPPKIDIKRGYEAKK